MRLLTAVFLTLGLAACMTAAERAAQIERDVDEMIQIYGPACEKLGYTRDTDKWRECVLHLSAKDDARFGRYDRRPTTTTCYGHRGFYQCSTF